MGFILTVLGIVSVLSGAAGLVIAAALPWATVTLLNTPLAIPGLALGWGGVTAGIGVICVAQFGILRRFAYLGIALGVAAAYIGVRAERETGESVVRYLLNVQRRLAPVNARLAEVTLPPIEPFGAAIKTRRDYVGAGVGYTIWAGGVVAAGSVLLVAGERLRRTCGYCRRAWSAKRGETVSFCTNCGKQPASVPLCAGCATPLLRGEKFCPVCGTGTSPNKTAVMTTKVV
ncbi:MAG: zinc ribbon domain-containing protein [Armatimonadetes bacterium]|nr:zinc ribbon domain-containing protein [Armatimonadota bacterium]